MKTNYRTRNIKIYAISALHAKFLKDGFAMNNDDYIKEGYTFSFFFYITRD